MITVVVSKEGYYINGEGVEAALRCSPALNDCGKPIFHELHHTYKVMFLALQAVARKGAIQGDVIVYNDSRIVDELNGAVPLDEVCQRWRQTIRREVMPHIRSIVMFRKKAHDFITSRLKSGDSLLTSQDPAVIQELSARVIRAEAEKSRSFKTRVLDSFKRKWKNE